MTALSSCRPSATVTSSQYGPGRAHAQRAPWARRNLTRGNPRRAVWSNWMEGRTGDDALLLDRLRRGDPAAFESLVIAHQHRVFGVALRMLGNRADAEEAAQEVFLRVHRALPGFRGDAKLSTWLYAIAARLCLSRLGEAHRRLVRADEAALARVPDPEADPARHLEEDEREAALRRAITELSDDRRMVV